MRVCDTLAVGGGPFSAGLECESKAWTALFDLRGNIQDGHLLWPLILMGPPKQELVMEQELVMALVHKSSVVADRLSRKRHRWGDIGADRTCCSDLRLQDPALSDRSLYFHRVLKFTVLGR